MEITIYRITVVWVEGMKRAVGDTCLMGQTGNRSQQDVRDLNSWSYVINSNHVVIW